MTRPPDAERPPRRAAARNALQGVGVTFEDTTPHHLIPVASTWVETRCRGGAACVEVSARVEAGHRTKYAEGCDHHGEQLLETARRIAEAHGYGSADRSVDK
jgi:hypothetical protein